MAKTIGRIAAAVWVSCVSIPARAEFPVPKIPIWTLACPREAEDAVTELKRHVASINAERERLKDELNSLANTFDTIKALTLADATKETGKITVLPTFPVATPTPPVPETPRLTQLRCFDLMRDKTKPVHAWRRRAADAAEAKERVEAELADLKATYEAFKATTADL